MTYKRAHLLSKIKRFHLEEQQRSNGDEQHTKAIIKFGKGESITKENLKIYDPLTAEERLVYGENPLEYERVRSRNLKKHMFTSPSWDLLDR
jgi:hypothetical protein